MPTPPISTQLILPIPPSELVESINREFLEAVNRPQQEVDEMTDIMNRLRALGVNVN